MNSSRIETQNPATEETLNSYSEMSLLELNTTIAQVQASYQLWRKTPLVERNTLLLKLRQLLIEQKQIFAHMISIEMGKPIRQARAEIDKCLDLCDYYHTHAETLLSPRPIKTKFQKSYVSYHPLGIIFAIMPWNFPIWQVFRFLVPAILAGNAALLKHAPNVTGCALLVENLMRAAGYPKDLFRILIIKEDKASIVIKHPAIKAITLTGSQRAGSAVAMQAGKAVKKVILELGGSDPYLILADADLEQAIGHCIESRLNNAGQVCIAVKRLLIEDTIYEPFKKGLLERLVAYQFGDPLDEDCVLGPLARADLRETLHQQITKSIKQGATLLLGGELPQTTGYYYPITVLENIPTDSVAYQQELFGPVFSLMRFTHIDEAIQIANSLDFGLGAAVFTADIAKGEHIADQLLDAGACFVNTLVASDPRLPFGGIKASGFGRELSEEGIREFTNIKTVCIQ